VPGQNSFDAVVYLNADAPRSFDGANVSFGTVSTDLETIVYGLICFEKAWLANSQVTYKNVSKIMEDPMSYGVLEPEASGYTEYDIPMMFRTNQHVNGQSKLFCNVLEVMTAVAESGLEDVSMGVFGSSSQNYNAGSAYHASAYLLSLMNLKSARVHLYDYFETSHTYDISGVRVESFTHPCAQPDDYNVIIDDTWLPGMGSWNTYNAEISSVKNFEEFPVLLQPFFKDGLMRETRKTTFEWDYQYKGSCFFSKRPCYECSYVYSLVTRLVAGIRLRNPACTYLDKLQYVLYSWIYRYKHKGGSIFMKNDYHASLLSVFITVYSLRDVNIHNLSALNLSEKDLAVFRKYTEIPSTNFDADSPELRLYSKISYSRFSQKLQFLSATKPLSIIDKFLKLHGKHDYVILSPNHITPSNYVENHIAVVEYDDDNVQYFNAYRLMVRERLSRIMLFSKKQIKLPLDMFSFIKGYLLPDFAEAKEKPPDFYVTVASDCPIDIYGDSVYGESSETLEQFKERMQIIGVRPGTTEYRRFQRYLNIRVTEKFLDRGITSENDYITYLSLTHKDSSIMSAYVNSGYDSAIAYLRSEQFKRKKDSAPDDPGGEIPDFY